MRFFGKYGNDLRFLAGKFFAEGNYPIRWYKMCVSALLLVNFLIQNSDLFSESIRVVGIKSFVRPHEGDEIIRIAEIDDVLMNHSFDV